MMYLLITKQIHLKLEGVIVVAPSSDIVTATFNAFKQATHIALDLETTGLNPWKNDILLISLYAPGMDVVVVIDTTTINVAILEAIDWKNKTVIGHNLQFDFSFLLWKNITFYQCWDTMVSELKLTQGTGYSVSLINTLPRRKIEVPEGMDKDIRLEFIQDDFVLEAKHVIYAGEDVAKLPELMEAQIVLMNKFDLGFFIRNIHNPLVLVLTKMKMQGFKFDDISWKTNADKEEAYCFSIVTKLHNTIKDKVSWQTINTDYAKAAESKTKGILRTTERLVKLTEQLIDLKRRGKENLKSFLKSQEAYIKASEALEKYQAIDLDKEVIGINWSSSKQALATFEALGIKPLPQAKSATTHQIQPSVSHAARDSWLLGNKEHKYYELIEQFHDFKNHLHTINSFGHTWVEKYLNPITNRVHTTYRSNTSTGRLSSGNAKEGLFNSQQIVGKNEYRNCFIAKEGCSITTTDLTGAELCIMAALAKDDRLLELSKGDMHSFFANKVKKAIYSKEGKVFTEADVISKQQNKQERTDAKPLSFGVIYGLHYKKAASILNIQERYGQIAIDAVASEIPKTIAMVKAATSEAYKNGYVLNNTRTNSRRWFLPILLARKEGRELTFMERNEIDGGSRNTRIQSTQADAVLEFMVTVDRWFRLYKIDAQLLLSIHDELVIEFKTDLTWFPARVSELFERVASQYLEGFLPMETDYEVGPYWIK